MIRPLLDWLVIKLDTLPEKKEGIILVAARDQERQYSGTIVRAGPGQWLTEAPNKRRPLGVEVGERVHFFRENFDTLQGKQVARIMSEVEPGMVMVRARDLLFADREPALAHSKHRKTKSVCEADKVEDRQVVLESDLVGFLQGDTP